LEEVGFGGFDLESFLEGVEDEAIGVYALFGGFGVKSLGEVWGDVEGDGGHGDGGAAQRSLLV
jgi:hypothetical protein